MLKFFKKLFKNNGVDLNESGIYKFTNKKTGDFYIGQSNNIGKRINAHKYNIDNKEYGFNNDEPKNHLNYKLAFDTQVKNYTSDDFEFEVLEKTPNLTDEERIQKEIQYIKEQGPAYNIMDVDKETQKKWSNEEEYNEWIKSNNINKPIIKNVNELSVSINWINEGYTYAKEYKCNDQYKLNKLDDIKKYFNNILNDKINQLSNEYDITNLKISQINTKKERYISDLNTTTSLQEQRLLKSTLNNIEDELNELIIKSHKINNDLEQLQNKKENLESEYNPYTNACNDFNLGWQKYKNEIKQKDLSLKTNSHVAYNFSNNNIN